MRMHGAYRLMPMRMHNMHRLMPMQFGGMNEVLYRLYRLTKSPQHLQLAHWFDKPRWCVPRTQSGWCWGPVQVWGSGLRVLKP